MLGYMDVESTSKKPKVWWQILFDEVKQYMLFFHKIERTTRFETLEKRSTLLQRNKFDGRICIDKSSMYAIKEKLRPVLGT